jgi:hypothetical protein
VQQAKIMHRKFSIYHTHHRRLLEIPIQKYLVEVLDLPKLIPHLDIIDPNLLAEILDLPILISYQKLI